MPKKTIISIFAILAIMIAIYGLLEWQQKMDDKPTRQNQEIR